ncbi:hypothetical protein IFM89_005567 [Coptis chinensis]|uniref:Uncharacterized protein n=1 Tax=Coptis chinensis TaxID=261450 RepID=A0A835H1P3_9MAGN|nr:hypothetical protein IFM89_005567 [Coptis chinensis]
MMWRWEFSAGQSLKMQTEEFNFAGKAGTSGGKFG